MRKILSIHIIAFISQTIFAQEYITEGKKRLNFAKTYFELGGQYSPSFNGISEEKPFKNSASVVPYLNIGGLHFWGHADFFISIPLAQVNLNKNDSTNFLFNQSIATGARFLPWAFRDKKIRPYLGASWAIVNFKQEQKAFPLQPQISQSKIITDVGILYGKGSFLTRLGMNIHPNNRIDYPIAPTNFQKIKLPQYSAYFGLVYAFESTRSKGMDKVNDALNKYPTLSKPSLYATNKGDWFVAFGPSTSFMVAKSGYNEATFPFFNKRPISNTFFDTGLGYQFNKAGIIAAVSYRNPRFSNEGFGVKQTIQKSSAVVEVFKFLTDYSGFTPYLGVNIGFDNIKYSEKSANSKLNFNTKIINPGLTFGWDILPGKTEQPFVLRTNLRWFPFEKIDINQKKFHLKQIEYNVIQLVYYPARAKRFKLKNLK